MSQAQHAYIQNRQQLSQTLFVKIKSASKFNTFDDMLRGRVREFLPDCASLEDGVATYRKIYRYAEQEVTKGVLAIEVEVRRGLKTYGAKGQEANGSALLDGGCLRGV